MRTVTNTIGNLVLLLLVPIIGSLPKSLQEYGVRKGLANPEESYDPTPFIRSELTKLNEDESTVIRRRFSNGHSFQEIAHVREIPEATVRAAYRTGMVKLTARGITMEEIQAYYKGGDR